MNIDQWLQQFNLHDHGIAEYAGRPVLKMPTTQPKYPNIYGAWRLSVMIRSLPCVLAFVLSDGQSYDPTTISDEDLERVLNHITQNCRPTNPTQVNSNG